jgi:hypothetical protein
MYCRAVLSTAGLGNKLFPWARCRAFALEHGIDMLAPNWMQLRLGPFLRADRDKRLYANLFKLAPPGYVSGLLGRVLSLTGRAVDEPADLHAPPPDRAANVTVIFRGERDHFGALNGRHDGLLHELRSMTREHWVRRADAAGPVAIGIHVRRGDFAEASRADDYILRGGLRTPIAWFASRLRAIRAACGFTVPATVVSDAPDHALRELLSEDAVVRVDTGSAVGDLLVLSRAKVLLASGGSSFSAWAAFLGQMPALAYPGQSLAWFKIDPTDGQYIGTLSDQDGVPHALLEHLDQVVTGRSTR